MTIFFNSRFSNKPGPITINYVFAELKRNETTDRFLHIYCFILHNAANNNSLDYYNIKLTYYPSIKLTPGPCF